ncbi:DUF6233 domain-containing protein [Streptomyces sp. Lzd4kr]|nr:DUF6233 domain-containing protein [Streptomyces sp. Lzd4kr]
MTCRSPDPDRLRTLHVRHALWVERIDARSQPCNNGRTGPTEPTPAPGLNRRTRHRRRPHSRAGPCGDRYTAGKRSRAVSRDEARRLLAAGLEACTRCHPAAHPRLTPPQATQ